MANPSRGRLVLSLLAVVATVAVSAAAMLVRNIIAQRGADMAFDTSVEAPAFDTNAPNVLFDSGHNNAHALTGRYAPFASLLRADGCRVRKIGAPILTEALSQCDVLVIVNARGPDEDSVRSAFTDVEISTIRAWVEAGGALLLVADHHPYGAAAAPLAQAFGVRMVGGWCDAASMRLDGTADTGAIAFTRESGALGEHPIIKGRRPAETVASVGTFTGQSLIAPESAAALLIFDSSAIDSVPTGSTTVKEGDRTITTFDTADTSAAGHCQALAMTVGNGRVVVVGEAAMLTAQIDQTSGLKFGMNVQGLDNKQFTLNVVRWLAGALE